MRGKRVEKSRPGCLIVVFLIIAFIVWIPLELFLSNNVLRRTNITVTSEYLPEWADSMKIVHLSDLHEKLFGDNNSDLIKMVEKAQPDIIAVTGDMLQSLEGLDYVRSLAPKLRAIAPVYYVTGNHEWAVDWTSSREGGERLTPALKNLLEESGIVYLDSSYLPLGDGMVIAGLCDPNGPSGEASAGTLHGLIEKDYGSGVFTVLLSHRYDMFSEYVSAGFDLVLAGHAHGGVVRLPFTDGLIGPGREWLPTMTSGANTDGRTTMIVSRGIGDTDFPRFLNRPEVITITLKRR